SVQGPPGPRSRYSLRARSPQNRPVPAGGWRPCPHRSVRQGFRPPRSGLAAPHGLLLPACVSPPDGRATAMNCQLLTSALLTSAQRPLPVTAAAPTVHSASLKI